MQDPDRKDLGQAAERLFSPGRGLWVVPIRHHSPACAWALEALIRDVAPTHLLIEGPDDFDRHIDNILDPGTRPRRSYLWHRRTLWNPRLLENRPLRRELSFRLRRA